MNAEIAKKWIAALRSGDYKQARGRLRIGDAFCCLGVLCNLHAQEHPKTAAKQRDPQTYMGDRFNMPTAVRRWAGISGGHTPAPGLPGLNDAGHPFEYIANVIEANVELL